MSGATITPVDTFARRAYAVAALRPALALALAAAAVRNDPVLSLEADLLPTLAAGISVCVALFALPLLVVRYRFTRFGPAFVPLGILLLAALLAMLDAVGAGTLADRGWAQVEGMRRFARGITITNLLGAAGAGAGRIAGGTRGPRAGAALVGLTAAAAWSLHHAAWYDWAYAAVALLTAAATSDSEAEELRALDRSEGVFAQYFVGQVGVGTGWAARWGVPVRLR